MEKEGKMERDHTVCVTGGTGFIASHIVQRLLELGYGVRATVRDPGNEESVAHLRDLQGAKERLTLLRANLLEEGSFDAAIKGVHGVFHIAAPVVAPNAKGDPHTIMIDPAVKGTLNVLRSCVRSSSVKRVVVTSSCAAIRYDYNRTDDDAPLDEACWSSTEYCREHRMWYPLAKTQAEREAWNFAQAHNLDLVVVNPSYVVGPFLGPSPTSTVFQLYHILSGKLKDYPNQIVGFVHIDDAVTAHILAYENDEAHGRYICSSSVAHWDEVVTMIRSKYPKLETVSNLTKRKDDNHEIIKHRMSNDKISKLGLQEFKSIESMFDDCIQDFIFKGLLPKQHWSPTIQEQSVVV